jgi:hypothetical protein
MCHLCQVPVRQQVMVLERRSRPPSCLVHKRMKQRPHIREPSPSRLSQRTIRIAEGGIPMLQGYTQLRLSSPFRAIAYSVHQHRLISEKAPSEAGERKTRHSHLPHAQLYEERELVTSAVPIRTEPDDIILGEHGLVRCTILNGRIHVMLLWSTRRVTWRCGTLCVESAWANFCAMMLQLQAPQGV